MRITTDLRVRSQIPDEVLEQRIGMLPGDNDYDVLLSGPTRVSKLDGKPLCVYLPGVLQEVDGPGVYDVLHELRLRISRNRGKASGTVRYKSQQKRSYTRPIASAIVGAIDPTGQQKYCRLTSWTGNNMPSWNLLQPLFVEIAGHFAEQVPERYHAQLGQVMQTDPAWVVPGTPFTTITVNNSYPTGVHTDKGDLDAGFSSIACIRKSGYGGGKLVFPKYRVAVDLHHGDLILMDAHEAHGNTQMVCACGEAMNGCCATCGAERISVVSYYRTKLVSCGSPEEERKRAEAYRDRIENPLAVALAHPERARYYRSQWRGNHDRTSHHRGRVGQGRGAADR